MKDGLLYATADTGTRATGTTTCDAAAGEDIGVTDIEGIVSMELGKVTVLRLPGIQRGGSRQADLNKLREAAGDQGLVCAAGVEALTALRRIGIEPACLSPVWITILQTSSACWSKRTSTTRL